MASEGASSLSWILAADLFVTQRILMADLFTAHLIVVDALCTAVAGVGSVVLAGEGIPPTIQDRAHVG